MAWMGDHGDLAGVVARWQQVRVVVLGDSFVDEWWYGEPERLSREAPVPIVALDGVQRAPGGAANSAVNIAALGARPVLVSPIGDDPEGRWLRHCLTEAGVEVAQIPLSGGRTPVKRRMVADGQIVLRIDSNGGVPEGEATADLIATTEAELGHAPEALVVCD